MKTLISLKPADNAGFSYCSIILITVVDDQLGIDPAPVLSPADPFLRNILHRQIQQLQRNRTLMLKRQACAYVPYLEIQIIPPIRS